jgi:hypothetical protein
MKLTFLAVACAFFATTSAHVISDIRAPAPPNRPRVPRRESGPSLPVAPQSEEPPKRPHAPRSPNFPDPYGDSFIAPQFEFGGFPANPPIPRMPEEIVRGLREGPRVPEEIENGFATSNYDQVEALDDDRGFDDVSSSHHVEDGVSSGRYDNEDGDYEAPHAELVVTKLQEPADIRLPSVDKDDCGDVEDVEFVDASPVPVVLATADASATVAVPVGGDTSKISSILPFCKLWLTAHESYDISCCNNHDR